MLQEIICMSDSEVLYFEWQMAQCITVTPKILSLKHVLPLFPVLGAFIKHSGIKVWLDVEIEMVTSLFLSNFLSLSHTHTHKTAINRESIKPENIIFFKIYKEFRNKFIKRNSWSCGKI